MKPTEPTTLRPPTLSFLSNSRSRLLVSSSEMVLAS